ncbi:MAG: transglutaminase family protein, partial [Elusimicrobiaceae bacterium]
MKRILILLLMYAAPARADILFLQNGAEIEGSFIAINGQQISIKKTDGEVTSYPRKDALKLMFVDRDNVRADFAGDSAVEAAARLLPADCGQDTICDAYREYTYVLDAGSSVFKSERVVRKLFAEEARDEAGENRYYYNRDHEEVSLRYAMAVNGRDAARADETTIADASEAPAYPEYDKLRSLKFSIPKVTTGTVTDYVIVSTIARVSREFPFFDRVPIALRYPARKIRISVTAPEGVALSTAASEGVSIASAPQSAHDGKTTTVWEITDVQADVAATKNVSLFCFGAQDTWEDIGKYFSARIGAALAEGKLPRVLRAGKYKTQKAKAAALYQYTADHIVFVPADMNASSYIPQNPEETLRRGRGNTLDKPFVFYALLKKAGIDAKLVYADSGTSPEFFPGIPAVSQFAKAAVYARLDGQDMWLCPLESEIAFGVVPAYLQGRTGLIVH